MPASTSRSAPVSTGIAGQYVRSGAGTPIASAGTCCAERVIVGVPPADKRGAMVVIKRILIATDFSEPSGVALAYARDLARSYGAQMYVLHVVEDVLLRYA